MQDRSCFRFERLHELAECRPSFSFCNTCFVYLRSYCFYFMTLNSEYCVHEAIHGISNNCSCIQPLKVCHGHWSRKFSLVSVVLLVVGFLSACRGRQQDPVEQWTHITRNRVEMFESLEFHSPISAVLEFGIPATILETHRSYARIRAQQQQGWVNRDQLIDYDQFRQVRTLTKLVEGLPSQGRFEVRGTLNIHVEPYRWAQTLYQLEKSENYELLDRVLVERLPMPSEVRGDEMKPTGLDYWHLAKLDNIGQVAWVLENMTYASIPLEIAKYAAGKRIIAYFALGEGEDQVKSYGKQNWLWFQSGPEDHEYDFDSMRVFKWDPAQKRYIVIQSVSGLVGYLPVEVFYNREMKQGTGTVYRFHVKNEDELEQRTYLFSNGRVHRISDQPDSLAYRLEPLSGYDRVYKDSAYVVR